MESKVIAPFISDRNKALYADVDAQAKAAERFATSEEELDALKREKKLRSVEGTIAAQERAVRLNAETEEEEC